MNSFEKLIRTALAKQDATSAQVRTQVYATARAALDRTLRDRPDLSAQAVADGRRSLESVIRQVEAEFNPPQSSSPTVPQAPSPVAAQNRPAGPAPQQPQVQQPNVAPPSQPASQPTGEPAVQPAPAARSPLSGLTASRAPATEPGRSTAAPPIETKSATSLAPGPSAPVRSVFGDASPSASAPKAATSRQEPEFGAPAPSPQSASDGAPHAPQGPTANDQQSAAPQLNVPSAAKSRRQRVRELRGPTRIYSWILSAAVLIAAGVIAVWWIQENDLLSPVAERDGATANPPGVTASGPAATGRVDERDWISILDAAQADRVVVNGANSARLIDFGGDPLIELTFATERVDGGDFFIEVDEAVLSRFAGQSVLLDFAMQGVSGNGAEDVSLSVECDFASMGDCGRKRYTVPLQPASMVFSVALPNINPGGPGRFRISGVGPSAQGGVIGLSGIRLTGDTQQ